VKGKNEYSYLYNHRIVAWHTRPRRRFRVRVESVTVNVVLEEFDVLGESKTDALRAVNIHDPKDKSIIAVRFLSDTVKSTVNEKIVNIEEV